MPNCPHPLNHLRHDRDEYITCSDCLTTFGYEVLVGNLRDAKAIMRLIQAFADKSPFDATPLQELLADGTSTQHLEASRQESQLSEKISEEDAEKAWGHEHRTRPAPKLT